MYLLAVLLLIAQVRFYNCVHGGWCSSVRWPELVSFHHCSCIVVLNNKKLVVILFTFQINLHNRQKSPNDMFVLFAGNTVSELGHTVFQGVPFLDSTEHGGFIYVRPSFQCVQKLILPQSPYLVAVLFHRYLHSSSFKRKNICFT